MADTCEMSGWDYDLIATPTNVDEIILGPGRLYMQSYCSDSTQLLDIGITSRDGITLELENEATTIFSDQHRSALRHLVHKVGAKLTFKLLRNTMDLVNYAMISQEAELDSSGLTAGVCLTGKYLEQYWRAELDCPYVTGCTAVRVRKILFPKLSLESSGPMKFSGEEAQTLDMTFIPVLDFDSTSFAVDGLLLHIRDVTQV